MQILIFVYQHGHVLKVLKNNNTILQIYWELSNSDAEMSSYLQMIKCMLDAITYYICMICVTHD